MRGGVSHCEHMLEELESVAFALTGLMNIEVQDTERRDLMDVSGHVLWLCELSDVTKCRRTLCSPG